MSEKKAVTDPGVELLSYLVLDSVSIPHCEEGQHEHFGPCASCDARGMQDAGNGLFKLCTVCGGTREGGPSLGMQACDLPATTYQPGQTVKLTSTSAQKLVEAGVLVTSPPNPDELIIRAAAKKLGMA